MLKVRFTNTTMVKRAESPGIVVLNQRINPRRIEREIFVKINACNNYFKYDHDTKRCDQDKKTLYAFCGEEGHKQGQCRSTVPKCLDCGSDHKTLAAKCQVRKNLIKKKRKKLRERSRSRARSQPRDANARTSIQEQTSYAERARGTKRTTGVRLEPSKELKEMTTIILSAIKYSHYKESLMPGSFQRNMSEICKNNGLTEVQFPEQTDVGEINDIYREILKDKADRMEMEEEEMDEVMEEETEQQTENGGAVPKRSREPSKSPIEKDSKKKKRRRKRYSHIKTTSARKTTGTTTASAMKTKI